MTNIHFRMLNRFLTGALDTFYFSGHGFSMAPNVSRKNISELLASGSIEKAEQDLYEITDKGRNAIKDGACTFATPSIMRVSNGNTAGNYTPPVWSVRTGANDNQRYTSRGF